MVGTHIHDQGRDIELVVALGVPDQHRHEDGSVDQKQEADNSGHVRGAETDGPEEDLTYSKKEGEELKGLIELLEGVLYLHSS